MDTITRMYQADPNFFYFVGYVICLLLAVGIFKSIREDMIMSEEMKKCAGKRGGEPTCGKVKPISEFVLTCAGNPSSVCLECDRKAKREYYQKTANVENKPSVDKKKLNEAVSDLFKRKLVA